MNGDNPKRLDEENDASQTVDTGNEMPEPHEETPEAQAEVPGAGARIAFSPARFRRALWIDGAVRAVAMGAVFLAFFILLTIGVGGSTVAVVMAVGALLAWVGLSAVGARVARALPGLGAALESNPEAAEPVLAEMLGKRALPRWVRMMLMHRLAALRHRQQDFLSSSAIAQTLLTTPRPGPAKSQRANLLLLLVEARLELRDALGAWLALVELGRTPLGLTEALQRMALRTRYELLARQDEQALRGIDQKMRLAELMPAPQCGALHAMLAAAAQRAGRQDWVDRLWPRVELLCSEEEIGQLRASGLAIS